MGQKESVMRELTSHKVNGLNESISIVVLDEPGSGGACHRYLMMLPHHYREWINGIRGEVAGGMITAIPNIGSIRFQNGPIGEEGPNGISNEALLAIVEDRLVGFQSGQFACRENAVALTKLQEAMMWLQKRTRDRVARGVEGTLNK